MIYKIWAIVGFVFLFLEIAMPAMFFAPLGGAAFFTSVIAYVYPHNHWLQAGAFALSALFIFLVCRRFMAKNPIKSEATGIEGKYLDNEALVTKDIASSADGVGEIKIYGEIWQAKSIDGVEIKAGEMVKIVKNESLIMFVQKI